MLQEFQLSKLMILFVLFLLVQVIVHKSGSSNTILKFKIDFFFTN